MQQSAVSITSKIKMYSRDLGDFIMSIMKYTTQDALKYGVEKAIILIELKTCYTMAPDTFESGGKTWFTCSPKFINFEHPYISTDSINSFFDELIEKNALEEKKMENPLTGRTENTLTLIEENL